MKLWSPTRARARRRGSSRHQFWVTSLGLCFEKDTFKDQGGIQEVHAVVFEVVSSFWFVPLDAHF